MCGLFGGISSNLTTWEADRIRDLGLISQIRGIDSTGILTATRAKGKLQANVTKAADNASNVLFSKAAWESMFQDPKPFVIAGHCRAATVGDVTDENAHPFHLGPVIGMHNGTIAGIEGKKDDGTDSEAMLTLIRDKGLQYAVDEARFGAYALCWMDSRDQTLNFIRNKERPLYMTTFGGCLYWASSFYILRLMMDHHKLGGADPKILDQDVHLKVKLNDPIAQQKRVEVKPRTRVAYFPPLKDREREYPEPKVEHVVLGPVDKEDLSNPDYIPWVAEQKKHQEERKAKGSVPDSGTGYRSEVKYRGFRSKKMSIQQAAECLKEGCAFCTEQVKISEVKKAHFFNNRSYLCNDCVGMSFARENVNAKELWPGEILMEKCDGRC